MIKSKRKTFTFRNETVEQFDRKVKELSINQSALMQKCASLFIELGNDMFIAIDKVNKELKEKKECNKDCDYHE